MTDFLPGLFFDIEPTTADSLRDKLHQHMEELKQMDVHEHTLWKKWVEVQEYRRFINRSEVVKAKIWAPMDFADADQTEAEVRALRPRIIFVHPEQDRRQQEEWLMLRIFCHTMAFDQNPGRFLRFLVVDEASGKYLGATSLASDVISIKSRDAWIGWAHKYRTSSGKLNNTAIGSCIMATQPFGYNFLGGKLVAALMTDVSVADAWESMTGHRLAGVTTTSLYGDFSMYNGIPHWRKLGVTQGKIYLKPDDSVYKEWHHWLKEHMPDEYTKATVKEGITGPVTGIKQKILDMAFRAADIKASRYSHGFQRGVYYAVRYENAREFLRGEIDAEQLRLHPRLAAGTDGIVSWWMDKAVNRYRKLHTEARVKPEVLYYNEGMDMTWLEFKARYFTEVGR